MEKTREQIIVRTSVIGIVANVFLAAFKATIGLLSNSIAVILDAVNNLSDALSSLITIIGTKLAQKEPDRKHPLGYGRVEYITAAVISMIVLYAGITSLVESVKKIIHPETPDYSVTALVIIAAAVVVKLVLGRFVKSTGEKVNSDSLIASGSDATFDAIISVSTLVAAILFLTLGWKLEAWLGAAISLVIIKAGLEMLRDTISEILGERIDAKFARDVKATIASFPDVSGAYDLIVHNYGPERLVGSVHIEVPDSMTVERLEALQRDITDKVLEEHGVAMTGISVYSVNARNEESLGMRAKVLSVTGTYPEILQTHGFYADSEKKIIRFDIVLTFAVKDRSAFCDEVRRKVEELFPGYSVVITDDPDLSD